MQRGACHCGKVRFEVEGDIDGVMSCTCSICRKSGFLHWIVDRHRVRFISGEEELTAYIWGSGIARHWFCPTCGVAPLRRPRMMPDSLSVNLRCLYGVDCDELAVTRYDGEQLELPSA